MKTIRCIVSFSSFFLVLTPFLLYNTPQRVVQRFDRPLVFSLRSDPAARMRIHTLTADGTTLRVLTDDTIGDAEGAVLSPDGEQIAFAASDAVNTIAVYLMNVDGSHRMRITDPDLYCRAPIWSPDGKKLLFECDAGIYLVDAGRRDLIAIAGFGKEQPAWSWDGRKIAFVASGDQNGRGEIFTMNADGSAIVRLTSTTTENRLPMWTPDGHEVIFTGWKNGHEDIYRINADASGLMNLTNDGCSNSPTWSPNGHYIAFRSCGDLAMMKVEGDKVLIVRRAGSNPGFLGNLAWAPDSTWLAYVAGDGNTPLGIFILQIDCMFSSKGCTTEDAIQVEPPIQLSSFVQGSPTSLNWAYSPAPEQ